MMIRAIFTFLGSIYLAILLITLTVLFVIGGTLLESYADSHKFAALWTYQNPVFALLIWGFFINILVSALRRWPFQWKHIPFLITHLGLLMILGGVFIKSYYGVQGSMTIAEGQGNNHILLPDMPALVIQTKEQMISTPLPYDLTRSFKVLSLNALVRRYAPHAIEKYVTWVKGTHAFILGLHPFEVHPWEKGYSLPLSGKVRFEGAESSPWNIRALRVKGLENKPIPENDELFIIIDDQGYTSLCCKDYSEEFTHQLPKRYWAYDKGFGGYTVPSELPIGSDGIILETPLTRDYKERPIPSKPEDRRPMMTLELTEGEQKEYLTLGYDRFCTGLKWPCLNGKYLLRFQPHLKPIPYRIRLHSGKQINYANSNQPFSYESFITVTDTRTGKSIDTTLRMNQVYQTWDGYRFYMSGITPPDNSAVHRVQIVVNHDPAKYWLTYPGALVLSLGIGLLFWLRPYKER